MTEAADQGQQDNNTPDNSPQQDGGQPDSGQQAHDDGHMIPKGRFDQINKERRELADRLAKLEGEQEAQAEERAKKQGEYQQLADKYKKQAVAEKEKRQQIEANWTRERRRNVWNRAASGIIKAEAISDAFDMLNETDFANIDEQDEAGFTRLAEQQAELRPYMADGPRGAGSGGSRSPVLAVGNSAGPDKRTPGSKHRPLFENSTRRPSWK